MSELSESAQEFEAAWWGDCTNTFGEEAKQITYAHRMGLVNEPCGGRWPVYDLGGRSVLDLGGGPVSLLLKCENLGSGMVVDPCPFPKWVADRYSSAGITVAQEQGETWSNKDDCDEDWYWPEVFDEAWIYNVLQHVESPKKVLRTARRHASVLRIFEWIEMAPCEGHPHTLHAAELNEWIGGNGTVEYVDENGAVGLAYYGCFDV